MDTSSLKGQILHDWLGLTAVGLPISGVSDSVSGVNAPTQRWIYDPASATDDTKVMSFQTPIGGFPDSGATQPQYCGKAVFSDVHAGSSPSGDVPGACSGRPLTEPEKALEFLLFDSAACVALGTRAPGQCRCP